MSDSDDCLTGEEEDEEPRNEDDEERLVERVMAECVSLANASGRPVGTWLCFHDKVIVGEGQTHDEALARTKAHYAAIHKVPGRGLFSCQVGAHFEEEYPEKFLPLKGAPTSAGYNYPLEKEMPDKLPDGFVSAWADEE